MSTGRSNIMDALPHASILTYFRRSQSPRQSPSCRQFQRASPPPPYTASYAHSPLLPCIIEAECENDMNEEPRYGGWGEEPEPLFPYDEDDDSDEKDFEGCGWGFCETVSLICYMLLIILLVLNLDAILSRMAFGSTKPAPEEMHFCLNATSRDAPVSRIWRFLPPLSHEDCTTEIATMTAEASDAWKLNSDDKVVFEDVAFEEEDEAESRKFIQRRSGKGTGAESISSADDRAEEGDLRYRIRTRRQN